jgi:hypothetical protein
MSNSYRRYEILLPLFLNDGTSVGDDTLGATILELRERFGAVSSESQVTHGQWQHEGEVYRDELVRIYVDVADSSENRVFFLQFKELLKNRFQQLDIWMTTYPLEVL